jgi:tripartite-type tricarboxylate transporter receptor subunit TctC
VDLPTATGTIFVQQIQAGSLRVLASTGPKRWSGQPEAPTLREVGIPVEGEAFWGALAPAGTPAPIQARYAEALRKAMAVPAVQERLVNVMGIDLAPRDGAYFGDFLAKQIETWGKVVRDNAIKPD